jgi:hypothetical protein
VSVDVLREVFALSQSRGVARNVLTVLSDAAHPDGVTWLPVSPPKNGDPTKCITHRANASTRAVRSAIAELVLLGEIEVRQAQRGRAKINVYRVVLGSVGDAEIDYTDLPFDLEQPFGRLNAESALSPGGDRVQFQERPSAKSVADRVQFSSPDESPQPGMDSAVAATFAAPYPSREPSLQPSAAEPPDIRIVSLDVQSSGEPAAAEPVVGDREICEAVLALPGADQGSPSVVIPIAYGLPRSVFAEKVELVRKRGGGVGLLVKLLRIARAERTAALSAQLLASLGAGRRYVPAPWTAEILKAEEPERYVRLMAKDLRDGDLRVALAAHDDERLTQLLELAVRVRVGAEATVERDTPEQARARWVDRHAATDPPEDVAAVIDAWYDVDPIERTALRERAERAAQRGSEDSSSEQAAA